MIVILQTLTLSNALPDNLTLCDIEGECKCEYNSVSCSRIFDRIPPFILTNQTETVHFTDVPIKIIDNGTLSGGKLKKITWVSSDITIVEPLYYSNLEYLDLSSNNISNLSDNTFDNCPKLEYINLSNNRISVLSNNLFLNTKLLETLNLEKNTFYSIPEHIFKETKILKNLSVGNPLLSVIAKNAMSYLDKLNYLNIENSSIENLNKSSFGEHNLLKSVVLNNCKNLISIDDDFFSLTPKIENIELNNCGTIQLLPSSIVSLDNLRRLGMTGTNVQPNCHNGWFSQWFNETTTVTDFEMNANFNETLNKLDCPPKIYHISGALTLLLTKRGIIKCMVYGNPRPAITWLVPGGITLHENKEADKNLLQHPNIHNWDLNQIVSQSLSTNKNGSLHIIRMLRANIGNYTCYVSNKYGNDSKTVAVHLDSGVFFNIKINALILGITSALGFLMLTIMCCALKLLLIRLV